MVDASFLDTGVVFGYCVPLDRHHTRCAEYVSKAEGTLYTTGTVESEFRATERDRVQELSTAVLDHRRAVANADLDASLGPTDIDHLRNRILDSDNDAARCLYRFYDDLGSFVEREDLLGALGELAREVESVTIQRKESLDATVAEWGKRDGHPTLTRTPRTPSRTRGTPPSPPTRWPTPSRTRPRD